MNFEVKNFNDLSGRRVGKLTVAWPAGRRLYGKRHVENVYLCFCECGKQKLIIGTNLMNGGTASCGAHHCRPKYPRHGQTAGRKFTPTYTSYRCAKQRCRDPKHENYPDYGGRGIEFRFTSYEQFHAHVSDRPLGQTLDRIDVNGHYEPGNVRWATAKQQRNNRRKKAA